MTTYRIYWDARDVKRLIEAGTEDENLEGLVNPQLVREFEARTEREAVRFQPIIFEPGKTATDAGCWAILQLLCARIVANPFLDRCFAGSVPGRGPDEDDGGYAPCAHP